MPLSECVSDQEHDIFVEVMSKKVADTLSFSTVELRVLEKFICVSKELHNILGTRAGVPSLLSINDPSLVPGRLVIAPVHSKLFLKAVDSRNTDSACQTESDVFHINPRGAEMAEGYYPQATCLPSASIPSTI